VDVVDAPGTVADAFAADLAHRRSANSEAKVRIPDLV
jgi:hypothetical protein